MFWQSRCSLGQDGLSYGALVLTCTVGAAVWIGLFRPAIGAAAYVHIATAVLAWLTRPRQMAVSWRQFRWRPMSGHTAIR
jgi:threonine/homoserine efflux transporter RhtA